MGCYWALGGEMWKDGSQGDGVGPQQGQWDLNKCPALPSSAKILHSKEWDNPLQTESSRAVGPKNHLLFRS